MGAFEVLGNKVVGVSLVQGKSWKGFIVEKGAW